ncbi:hypothetical protein [Actinoplanes sp. NPDC049118]|uniref:hypothetical protein n=1 Tax=Actinoplanes sp. NPDC049118 TaxID=3155769 RepID=UPI0033E7D11C
MRKWFYAGAVVGGVLLLGAAPAQADLVPVQTDGLVNSADGRGIGLDPAGSLNLESPLGGANQLMNIKPGQNSADLQGLGSLSDMMPRNTGLLQGVAEPDGRAQGAGLVPAGVPVGGLTRGGTSVAGMARGATSAGGATAGRQAAGGLPTGNLTSLIPSGLLSGGLLGGGLLPAAGAPRESALFDGGLPLLGGLGGLLPANEVPDKDKDKDKGKDKDRAGDADDVVTGMPAGGTAVDPATVDPATVDPAIDEPVRDPRVHEEPIDNEAGGDKRSFSGGGRPIAGVDEDFK